MNLKKSILYISLIFIFVVELRAQKLGFKTYDFLGLVNSSRVASLGGYNVSVNDSDLNIAFLNPSVMDSLTNDQFVLNYADYFTDINYGYVAYAKDFKKYGTFSAGIHYVDYGDFTKADSKGTKLGNFSAQEMTFNIAWSYNLFKNLNVGASLKPVYSSLENYTSYGLVADFGAIYKFGNKRTSLGIVARNIGAQLKPYRDGNRETVPWRMDFGITHKLAKAPLRLSVTYEHLEEFDLTFQNTNTNDKELNPKTGEHESVDKNYSFVDKFARHLIFGVEVIPFRNFHVNLSYNYRRNQELKVKDSEKFSFNGVSWGVGFKVYKFHVSYGRAVYYLGKGTNHFSISTRLSELL